MKILGICDALLLFPSISPAQMLISNYYSSFIAFSDLPLCCNTSLYFAVGDVHVVLALQSCNFRLGSNRKFLYITHLESHVSLLGWQTSYY